MRREERGSRGQRTQGAFLVRTHVPRPEEKIKLALALTQLRCLALSLSRYAASTILLDSMAHRTFAIAMELQLLMLHSHGTCDGAATAPLLRIDAARLAMPSALAIAPWLNLFPEGFRLKAEIEGWAF